MRNLRPIIGFLAIAAITVACSTPGASSGGQQSQAPGASQRTGASEPAASTGGGGGGGANGSITYQITGDYTASGELPFIPVASSFASGGWAAYFADTNGKVIQLNTDPGIALFGFGENTHVVSGVKGANCTFNFTKNDSGGLAGSMECHDTQLLTNATGALGKVNVNAHWDAHP